MFLSDMRDRLRRKVGSPTTTDTPDSDLDRYINYAYKDIANKWRFHRARKRATFATVAGESDYDVPGDLVELYRVKDTTSDVRLKVVDDNTAQTQVNQNVPNGAPTSYIRYQDYMLLMPTPDAAYIIELYYKVALTDLVAPSDSPRIPATWHEGILQYAKYYYYDDVGDTQKAATALQNFEVWASRQPVEVDEEQTWGDQGIVLPSLSEWATGRDRLDFIHGE